jgi:hypothetical protein
LLRKKEEEKVYIPHHFIGESDEEGRIVLG